MAEVKAYLGKNPYIFISYAHKNKDIVYPFIAALQEHYNVWFDEGITYGNDYQKMLTSKIRNCALFIYFITNESLESRFCQNEIFFADEKRKPFINIIAYENTVLPDEFVFSYGRYQMCNLFKFSSCKAAVADLAKKCEALKKVVKDAQEEASAPPQESEESAPANEESEAAERKKIEEARKKAEEAAIAARRAAARKKKEEEERKKAEEESGQSEPQEESGNSAPPQESEENAPAPDNEEEERRKKEEARKRAAEETARKILAARRKKSEDQTE